MYAQKVREGTRIDAEDAMIAGIALENQQTLFHKATRRPRAGFLALRSRATEPGERTRSERRIASRQPARLDRHEATGGYSSATSSASVMGSLWPQPQSSHRRSWQS